jgi:4-hydroxy-tetrahydrodipicolinate synthase
MHEMCAAALRGEVGKAREINMRLLGLHQKLFVEANPIPVKWALQQMGLAGGGIRLPMTPLSEAFFEVVREAMNEAGINTKAAGSGLRVA